MATSRTRMKKIADQIEDAAGKASVKVEDAVDKAKDKASEVMRDLRETGRDIDDKLDEWADENANVFQDAMSEKDASRVLKAVVWILAILAVIGLLKGLAHVLS